MQDRVQKLLTMDIQDVLKSPEYSMLLLKTYSVLYLNGGRPKICSKSQKLYFNILKKTGMKKAKELDIKTCKLKKEGLMHSSVLQKHVLLSQISDSDAITLLKAKTLKESDFEILPEGYKKPSKNQEKKIEKKAENKVEKVVEKIEEIKISKNTKKE